MQFKKFKRDRKQELRGNRDKTVNNSSVNPTEPSYLMEYLLKSM